MSQSTTTVNRVRPDLLIAIFLCLFSLYLASYSGRIESSDSLRVFDATNSLVNFGDVELEESLWQSPPRNFALDDTTPYGIYNNTQPLMPYLTAIPYALAKLIPNVGQVHATWLLNMVMMALSGCLMYVLGILLGYKQKISVMGALLFGLGTIAWAYSKTLFRDPVTLFFLLVIFVLLELWRRNRLNILWVVFAVVLFILAEGVKSSVIVALPALLIWILPQINLSSRVGRILDSIFFLSLILLFGASLWQPLFDLLAIIPSQFFFIDTQTARVAIHSYLFSIGGSVWATSPIVLLGIVGTGLLIKQGKRRIVWSVFIMLVGYATGHALLTQVHWFGGLSLPPRFMLPTIPFLMLLVLPVLESALGSKNRLIVTIVSLIALFSIAVQAIFAVSLVDAYVELLPAEANGLVEWLPGLNQPQYLRWLVLPQSWNSLGWDIAWTRITGDWIGLGFLGLASLAWVSIILQKYRWLVIGLTVLGIFGLSAYGLSQLHQHDTVYWANTPELFEVLFILESEAEDGEPVFLAGSADVTYERFMLNYNTSSNFRPVVLGFQQGERTSLEDTPTVISTFNRDRLDVTTLRYIDQIASNHERIWWLAHNSDFTPWAIRPEEQYLFANYYLINEYETGNPTVRLLEFSTVQAPDRHDFRLPEYSSSFRFGENITLAGYALPSGQTFTAGDVVPITFYWQTDALIDVDYTIATFLVNTGVVVLEGIDSPPDGGFTPTTAWQPNQLIPENRAILLPDDAPVGTYQIWLRLYVTGTGGAEQLTVEGGEMFEDTTAILPITIEVMAD